MRHRKLAVTIWGNLILFSLVALRGGGSGAALPCCAAAEASPGAQANTFWTSGGALLPAWGFYPLNAEYGGTRPLGESAAWNASDRPATLTWVADFPAGAEWQVWVRQYGGYGTVAVTLDERPFQGARGGPGGGRFVWRHAGSLPVASGPHHIDIVVTHGMFDALVFTSDAQLQPDTATLPAAIDLLRLRAHRSWRNDKTLSPRLAGRPLLIGTILANEETLYDWVPRDEEPTDRLELWGAAGQYVNGTLVVRALDQPEPLRVSLPKLTGSNGGTIPAEAVDLRVVLVWERKNHLYHDSRSTMLVPELLLRDDRSVGQAAAGAVPLAARRPPGRQGGFGGGECRTLLPPHQSRQLWLTFRVPAGCAAGLYRGELVFERISEAATPKAAVLATLPVELEILPSAVRTT